jgi:hypothetical protein
MVLVGPGTRKDPTNTACLSVIDEALFLICLDDATPAREGNENQRPNSGQCECGRPGSVLPTFRVERTIFVRVFKQGRAPTGGTTGYGLS